MERGEGGGGIMSNSSNSDPAQRMKEQMKIEKSSTSKYPEKKEASSINLMMAGCLSSMDDYPKRLETLVCEDNFSN